MNPGDRETLRIIAGWLNDLSALVIHFEEKPTTKQLAVYANMLMEDLPSTAFTLGSLHRVASGMTRWPAFATVRTEVLAWWNENKPAASPLLGYDNPAAARLSKMDQLWLAFYHKRIHEGANRALLDSLLRQQSRPAWDLLNPPMPSAPLTDQEHETIRLTIDALKSNNDQSEREARRIAMLTQEQLARIRQPTPLATS